MELLEAVDSSVPMVTVFLSAWIITNPALPTNLDAQVRQGVAKYDAVNFRGAKDELARAIERKDLSKASRKVALAYLASACASLNQMAAAEQAYGILLLLDPKTKVSEDESPRVRKALRRARQRYKNWPRANL